MTTYLGKSCSFGLPRLPFVNCRQFMYLVISLLVLRAGCGIWLYQFQIIAYLFTLLSTRKHWTINPSLAQAHHRHYRHIAFISFQLKISTPFRKLSKQKKKKQKNKKKTKKTTTTLHSITFLFCFNSKYHFNFLCVKLMEKWYDRWSQDVVDIVHWNCLAWQQSTSSGHPFFHPKPRNCPHQINPFPARNNPRNACLCVLPPALLGANRVSPLNRNPVPVDTLPDEMASIQLHIGKPVTSRHCLTY